MSLFIVLFRTIFFYFFVLISYRIMGKREIGQLGVIDLIVSILIAELVAISIEEYKQSLMLTVIPISILVLLEVLFAFFSIKSRKFRLLFDGKPSLIIANGKINYKEMIKQRYSLDDLLVSLRQKEIRDLSMVEYAFLEPNGELSVFKYNFFKLQNPYPAALILDGELQKSVIKHIHKTEDYIKEELSKKNLTVKDIFYAFYKNKKIYIIKKTDLN